MKVLALSRTFLPTIGGLEIRVAQLAGAWAAHGLAVTVVTKTAGSGADSAYRVVRNPSWRAQIKLFQWADIVYQPNLSLRDLWPLALVRRPWIVSHHSWYTRTDGSITLPDKLKRAMTRRADASIAVSQALASDLGPGTVVIPNPFRQDLFRLRSDVERDRDLLFVGRLVSDKGLDILLEAMALLAAQGNSRRLTIVGDGPERAPSMQQAQRLGIEALVTFAGMQTGERLARTMNQHSILVVPSRYREPFGIVAVEGIASGCIVVGSAAGGLPEAIGPCGLVFENGNARELAVQLDRALNERAVRQRLENAAPSHLAKFATQAVVDSYLRTFAEVTEK